MPVRELESWKVGEFDSRLVAGGAILGLVAGASLLLPVLHGPLSSELNDVVARRFAAPFARTSDGTFHLLGTARFGRDMLVRLAFGARVSLVVGFLSALVATLAGVLLGAVAGYVGGAWTAPSAPAPTSTIHRASAARAC